MSAALSDVRTENQAITAASRSFAEWMASETMLTEPESRPTASFIATRQPLEATDTAAARDFALIDWILLEWRPAGLPGAPPSTRTLAREA